MSAALTSGIWNNTAAAANPMATTGSGGTSGSNSGDSNTAEATITANDFLTLLVTEMQNQDPTADTDPNEYINQLVNVNSLEQLIQINQTLSGAATSTTTPSAQTTQQSVAAQATPAAQAHAASQASSQNASSQLSSHSSGHVSGQVSATAESAASVVAGNFGIPKSSRSALGVSRALEAPRITR